MQCLWIVYHFRSGPYLQFFSFWSPSCHLPLRHCHMRASKGTEIAWHTEKALKSLTKPSFSHLKRRTYKSNLHYQMSARIRHVSLWWKMTVFTMPQMCVKFPIRQTGGLHIFWGSRLCLFSYRYVCLDFNTLYQTREHIWCICITE